MQRRYIRVRVSAFESEKKGTKTMAVITLNYNQHDAASRRLLNNLLATGLFVDQESLDEHRRMRDAAVYTSQRNMASFIAKYI